MTATAGFGPAPLVSPSSYTPLAVERVLVRLNELLLRRDGSDRWWSSLARTVDDLSVALAEHRAVAEGFHGLHDEILEEQPRLAHDVRALERDHVELADEVSELRTLISESAGGRGRISLVLAAGTEVLARIRGHERRLRTVLHEAYQRDLGGGD
jgi:hypothetical protein